MAAQEFVNFWTSPGHVWHPFRRRGAPFRVPRRLDREGRGMEDKIAFVMRNAWAVLAGLLVVGGGLALVGASLPAVAMFLLAGLLLMAFSHRGAATGPQAPPDADTA
jgi:hypothetical protein